MNNEEVERTFRS